MSIKIRDFCDADGPMLNAVALAAFSQFENNYLNWPAMAESVSRMSLLASSGEVIVADKSSDIVGGVVYVPGGRPKASYFDVDWPIIRMLVVDPNARGQGIGRLLTEECIARACRDEAPLIALHTTKIMTVAQPMYVRMGFDFIHEAPPIHGVPYGVYIKKLR